MNSSLVNNVWVDLRSAGVILGVTEGELYACFDNHPPHKLNLGQIDKIQLYKLNNGSYGSPWFDSVLATTEPLIKHSVEKLCSLLPQNEDLIGYFKLNLPRNINLGGTLEVLRMVHLKFPALTGDLSTFISKLSNRGFFQLHD